MAKVKAELNTGNVDDVLAFLIASECEKWLNESEHIDEYQKWQQEQEQTN